MLSLDSVRLKLKDGYSSLERTLPHMEKLWPVSGTEGSIMRIWDGILLGIKSRLQVLQRPRNRRLCYKTVVGALIILILYDSSPFSAFSSTTLMTQALVPPWPYYNPSAHLPHIPPNIWQLQLDFSRKQNQAWDLEKVYDNQAKMFSWIALSPGYKYALLDTPAVTSIMQSLSSVSTLRQHPEYARYVATYKQLTRGVMRTDFMRYLMVAIEGGVYSDTDTQLLKPIIDWVPEEYRNETRLIVGIEGDRDPLIPGMAYEVQFCQWTLASAKGHSAMWMMVERIVEGMEARLANMSAGAETDRATRKRDSTADASLDLKSLMADVDATRISTAGAEREDSGSASKTDRPASDIAAEWSLSSSGKQGGAGEEEETASHDASEDSEDQHLYDPAFPTDEDVLTITGPRGWTLAIYEALSAAVGWNVTWHNLTGLREPKLFGDILVLPIDGFATGLTHSGSTLEGSPYALVRHSFEGSWRGGNG